MPRANYKQKKVPKPTQTDYICAGCGKMKKKLDFFSSTNPIHLNGVIPFCKECIKNMSYDDYGKFDINRFKKMLMMVDKPYIEEFFNRAIEGEGETIGKYFQKIGMPAWKDKRYKDSQEGLIKVNKESIPLQNEEDDMAKILIWGGNYSVTEFEMLEDFYYKLITNYECNTPIQEALYRNLAKIQLNADRALNNNDIEGFNKLMTLSSKLMTDANIKPNQENSANADSLGTYGLWVKHIENDEPIPKATPEFEDVDNIGNYFQNFLLKQLKKIFGLINAYDEKTMPKMEDLLPSEAIMKDTEVGEL